MVLKIEAATLESAYVKTNFLFTNRSPVYYKPSYNSFRNDHYLNAFNIMIESLDSLIDLSLEDIGYTKSKILHLLKSYLDPVKYREWIEKIKDTTETYGRVDSDIGLQTTGNSKHSNGPCLLGFSFRSHSYPVLTVYSRSVELPQAFGADAILISAIAKHISKTIGLSDDQKISVNWYISSARIRSRAANFFRLYTYPYLGYEYQNELFHSHIEKQWDNILADQHKKVSFSKLVKMQQEYKRVVIENREPDTRSGTEAFLKRLEEGWKV